MTLSAFCKNGHDREHGHWAITQFWGETKNIFNNSIWELHNQKSFKSSQAKHLPEKFNIIVFNSARNFIQTIQNINT